MKEEALKLADELAFHQGELSMWTRNEACRMIRRLVEELDKQGKPVAWMSPDGKVSQTEGKLFHIPLYAAQKPLSDDEILDACITDGIYDCINDPYYDRNTNTYTLDADLIKFARAIEERHGIK